MHNSISSEQVMNIQDINRKASIPIFPQQLVYSSPGQLYRTSYIQNEMVNQWHPFTALSNSLQLKEHCQQSDVISNIMVKSTTTTGLDEVLSSHDYEDHIFPELYSHTDSPDTGPCTIDMQVLSFSGRSATSSILTPLTPSTGPSSVDTNGISAIERFNTSFEKSASNSFDQDYVTKSCSELLSSNPNELHSLNSKGPLTSKTYKWGMKLNFLAVARLSASGGSAVEPPAGPIMHPTAWLIEGSSQLDGDNALNRVDKLFIEKSRSCELFIHLQPASESLECIKEFQKDDLCLRLETFSMTPDDSNTKLPLKGGNKQTFAINKGAPSTESMCFVNCWQRGCEYQELENGFVVCRVPLKRSQETVTLCFPHLNSKCESAWKKHVFLDCVLVSRQTGEILAPMVRYQIYCCSSPARDAQRMFTKMTRKPSTNSATMSTYTDSPLMRKRELSSWSVPEENYQQNGSPSKMQKLTLEGSALNNADPVLEMFPQNERLQNSQVSANGLTIDEKGMQTLTTFSNETPQYVVLTNNLAVWKILNGLKYQLEQLCNANDGSIS